MAGFVNINEIVEQIKKKSVISWIDRLTFFHILVIWVSVIFLFGIVYYFFTGGVSHLLYSSEKGVVGKITDTIYFSFVTATTTGFGDIIPKGSFKIIAIFEVLFGLMLLALVTSKLVSIKQDMILNEMYELSFNEKINRLRSSLLLFRQNLSRVITKIEDGSIKKREVSEMYMYLSSLEDTLNETTTLTQKSNGSYFTKTIDPMNTELLLNSILSSFEKLNELIGISNQNKIEWRRDITLMLINKCIALNENLFHNINSSKSIHEKIIGELNMRKKSILAAIKSALEPSPAVEAS